MRSFLPNTAFFFLFPFIFFYSSAVSAGLIPGFIGGGVGFVMAVFGVLLIPVVAPNFRGLRGSSIAYSLLIVSFFFVVVAQWLVVSGELSGAVRSQWLTAASSAFLLIVIGLAFYVHSGQQTGIFLFWCLLVSLVVILLNIDPKTAMYRFGIDGSDSSLSYQGLARSVAYCAVGAMAWQNGAARLWATYIAGLVALFFIGARAEMIAYSVISALLLYLQVREGGRKQALAVGALGAFVVLCFSGEIYQAISGSRQMQIFDLSSASSMQARNAISASGWEAINNYLLVGDFGGHVRYGYSGEYMHNALSAWRQLGIIGFALYLALNLVPLGHLGLLAIKRPGYITGRVRLVLSITAMNAVLVLLAKPVFWPFYGFAWGAYLAFLIEKNPSHNR